MNKIFTLLLVGALTAGAVTANAESQIFKKKKKKAKAETEPLSLIHISEPTRP